MIGEAASLLAARWDAGEPFYAITAGPGIETRWKMPQFVEAPLRCACWGGAEREAPLPSRLPTSLLPSLGRGRELAYKTMTHRY